MESRFAFPARLRDLLGQVNGNCDFSVGSTAGEVFSLESV
jgi:hypothetical protein